MKTFKAIVIFLIIALSIAVGLKCQLAVEAARGYDATGSEVIIIPAGLTIAYLVGKYWRPRFKFKFKAYRVSRKVMKLDHEADWLWKTGRGF